MTDRKRLSYSRYVGRVGTLAVALGVGIAVAPPSVEIGGAGSAHEYPPRYRSAGRRGAAYVADHSAAPRAEQ